MNGSGADGSGVNDRSTSVAPIHPHDRPPRSFLQGLDRLERSTSVHGRRRIGLVVGFGAAIGGTLAVIGLGREFGVVIPLAAWTGLFLANWVGNGGLLVPIPGLRFIGWTMTVHQGTEGVPIIVGLIAGLAMALGQTSYYLSASAGSRRIHDHVKPRPRSPDPGGSERTARIRKLVTRIHATIESLLRDYGVPTIFSLSAVPNPFTTFASITAGSIGMAFRRFLLSNFAGHVVLGLILSLFGVWLIGP